MPYGVKPASAMPRPAIAGDQALYAYLDQLPPGRSGQRALVCRLSRLMRAHRREKHLQIVANMLQDVTRQFPGRFFSLRNGDFVLVSKGITRKALDEITDLLRYLFNDDPLTREGVERADFCASFDLEVSYAQFLAALDEIRDSEIKRAGAAARRIASSEAELRALGPGAPDHKRVGELLEAMACIDLSAMVRRQTVWEMVPDKPPQPRFDEFFVSIDRLREATGPNFDLAKDRQLFQYLMRWLDKHMLATLLREASGVSRPVSVNISVATLLAPEFVAFDQRRPTGWRDRIILEVNLSDLWSDLPAFLSVSQVIRSRGYLQCLDGVIHQALPFLHFERFDFDFVKVMWDDALLQLDDKALRRLCEAIAECGKHRVVLARCGRREAIRVGQVLGIQLFQGWQVDHANRPS